MTRYTVFHADGSREAVTLAAESSFTARLIVAGETMRDITDVYAVAVRPRVFPDCGAACNVAREHGPRVCVVPELGGWVVMDDARAVLHTDGEYYRVPRVVEVAL